MAFFFSRELAGAVVLDLGQVLVLVSDVSFLSANHDENKNRNTKVP